LSNGAVEYADEYKKGDDGFVVCKFKDRDLTLTTEIPNECLDDKGHIDMKVPSTDQPMKKNKKVAKKPAANVMKKPSKGGRIPNPQLLLIMFQPVFNLYLLCFN